MANALWGAAVTMVTSAAAALAAYASGFSWFTWFLAAAGGLVIGLEGIAGSLRLCEAWLRWRSPLQIAVDPPPSSCVQDELWEAGSPVFRQYRRVRVTNRSPRLRLTQVRVQLESFTPQGAPFLPQPLKEMNDNPNAFAAEPFQVEFDLNPGQSLFFDLASKLSDDGRWSEFMLRYASWNWPNAVPDGTYEIVVLASANNVPWRRETFTVSVAPGDARLTLRAGRP